MKDKLSPEVALGLYADKIQAAEVVDLEYFKARMTAADYAEFIELIPCVDMVKSSKEKDKFERMLAKIQRKSDMEAGEYPMVAGFRTDDSKAVTKETRAIVDKIFNEVFGDEEE